MKNRGFTLIEIVCVLGICGILLNIVFINNKSIYKQIKDNEFKHTCMNLISDLRYAKVYALTHGYIKVIFNENGYTLFSYTTKNNTIKDVKFHNDIKIDHTSLKDGALKITFTERNTVLPSGCTIAVRDNAGNSSEITIKPITYTIDYKSKSDDD